MNNNRPARLTKAEPLKMEYNRTEIYVAGFIFITVMLIICFAVGSENLNYILLGCV